MRDPACQLTPATEVDALPLHIALMATIPGTLKVFYQPLIDALNDLGRNPILIASPGDELDEFERDGRATVHRVPMTRSISPLHDATTLARLVRCFRRDKIDLLHTHTPKAGLLGMIAGRIARIGHRVHTLHGLPLETATGWKRRLLHRADRTTCSLADVVCVVSKSIQDRANELALSDPTRRVILGDGTACGVDLKRFQKTAAVLKASADVRARFAIPTNARVVGFVGWLVVDKGVTELVRAFEQIAASRDDTHLLMIGADGGARDPLPESTLTAIRQHPRIHHAGLVDDPAPYYAAMDVCVLPTKREGFPYALLEAGAMEVPVVATRVTGCVDAVVDGETGILVEPGDAIALRESIERLIGDEALRKRMGHAARLRTETLFDSKRLVEAHLELYRSIARGNGVGGRVQSL